MKYIHRSCLTIALAFCVQAASASESALQIQLATIKTGDAKEKVLAILGQPSSQEVHQVLDMGCEYLVYKKPFSQEEATVTLCFSRVIATKYASRSLLGL